VQNRQQLRFVERGHDLQTSLLSNPRCPFRPFLEVGDDHCFEPRSPSGGYEVISEDHPDLDLRLAEVNNIGFGDIQALPISAPMLPAFIPSVGNGNGRLFSASPDHVATTLGDLVSPVRGNVRPDIHEVVNMPKSTTVLLLGYTNDVILEKIWTDRYLIIPKLAQLDCVITAPDYSVFSSQPHAERLINMKRSLVIFGMLQQKGARVIPHMHWSGPKDLRRWSEWINGNTASAIAIDLQMLEPEILWRTALTQLVEFVSLLNRELHFVVSGPSTPLRIREVASIFSSLTITSGLPVQAAIRHRRLAMNSEGGIIKLESDLSIGRLTELNIEFIEGFVKTANGSEHIVLPAAVGSGTRGNR